MLPALLGLALAQQTVPVEPITRIGVTMNVNLADESIVQGNFRAVEGWADHVRFPVGMDMEGWFTDSSRWEMKRLERLSRECARRGIGVHLILGGVPPKDSPHWQKFGEAMGYQGKRYNEMPQGWWHGWCAWQKHAVRTVKRAYGPGAERKIRIQLPNEVFDRGEDDQVDAFFRFALPKIVQSDGTIYGLPMDGPSLWGPPEQLYRQIRTMKRRVADLPEIYRHVRMWPLNAYPLSDDASFRDPERMRRLYVDHCRKALNLVRTELGGQAYFSEIGVSRAYAIWPQIWGDRQNEIAERVLLSVVKDLRALNVPYVTIYQLRDTSAEEQRRNGYGLIDAGGRATVSLDKLKNLAR